MRRNLHLHSRRGLRGAALAVLGVASIATASRVWASDHQDTPEVELNPRMDINDVYAFPGSAPDRIALVLTTSSPIAGQNASFDPSVLYQFKIDNTGDAVEDLVIQVTFDQGTGTNQHFTVRGPVAPAMTGTSSLLVASGPSVTGTVGTATGTAPAMQAFAGLRADPFVIDLEQFFNIIPDRRPSSGPLSGPSTPTASAFRNPGVDFTRPFNALAIVIELPKAMLQPAADAGAKLGLWATTSR
jgi:hypothetical protein